MQFLNFLLMAGLASADAFKFLQAHTDTSVFAAIGIEDSSLVLGTEADFHSHLSDFEVENGELIDTSNNLKINVDAHGFLFESHESSNNNFSIESGSLLLEGEPLLACKSPNSNKFRIGTGPCALSEELDIKLTSSSHISAFSASKREAFTVPSGVKDVATISSDIKLEFQQAKNTIGDFFNLNAKLFGALAINVGTKFNQMPIRKHASSSKTFFVGGDEGERVFFYLKSDSTLVDQFNKGIHIFPGGFVGNVQPEGNTDPTPGWKIIDGHLTLNEKSFFACETDDGDHVLSSEYCNYGTPVVLYAIF